MVYDQETMSYTLKLVKKFEFSQLFKPVVNGDLTHPAPIALVIAIVLLAFAILTGAWLLEMKLQHHGSTGTFQRRSPKTVRSINALQQEKLNSLIEKSKQRQKLSTEQTNKCLAEANIL